ncbi:hypothetical protein RND81_08G160900 [Saponaria officinalis]|uniref:Uncharacterized protein n=1 Tax=Saponaria officinalis TaxID=3572 RepID=A0AAW1J811_SAPOF
MSSLPTITKVTTEIAEYLTAVDNQAEVRKLFHFLNGLDKEYAMLRSNILLMDPLPKVENTVSMVLQEEIQANNLGNARIHEGSALMIRSDAEKEKCVHCGRENHKSEMCWEIKGYPVGHPKHKRTAYKPGFRGGGYTQQKAYQYNARPQNYKRSVANVKTEQTDLSAAIGAATLQLENLLKLVPGGTNANKGGGESEE